MEKKSEEKIKELLDGALEKLNTSSMLPFIRKKVVMKIFVKFADAVICSYRQGVEENNNKTLCRLAELDWLYEERERERKRALTNLVEEIKSEMVRRTRIAFFQCVCKFYKEKRNTSKCFCVRKQKVLKSLENCLDKYIQDSKERITTKFNKASWKK